jgi:hypothetical protein
MHEPIAPKRVFVSYASQDATVADSICASLERQGLACWIAPRDVIPGERYADAIVHAISAAPIVVLVLSGHAVASPHVAREVERACAKRRPVIAFRIDSEPMTPAFEYFLSDSQWLDARACGVAQAMTRLVPAVRRCVSADPATEGISAGQTAKLPTADAEAGGSGPRRGHAPATERGGLFLLLLLLGRA